MVFGGKTEWNRLLKFAQRFLAQELTFRTSSTAQKKCKTRVFVADLLFKNKQFIGGKTSVGETNTKKRRSESLMRSLSLSLSLLFADTFLLQGRKGTAQKKEEFSLLYCTPNVVVVVQPRSIAP